MDQTASLLFHEPALRHDQIRIQAQVLGAKILTPLLGVVNLATVEGARILAPLLGAVSLTAV